MPVIQPELQNKLIQLDTLELNSLYYLYGYIINSICKNQKTCEKCIDSAGSKKYDSKIKYSQLVSLKCYRKNTLFYVNDKTFTFFLDFISLLKDIYLILSK